MKIMNEVCEKRNSISEEDEKKIEQFSYDLFNSLDGNPPHVRREILRRAHQMTEKAYREKVYNSHEELKQNEMLLAAFLGEI